MTESKIQDVLWKHYESYFYHLENSYVYQWESDFFCISTSGYAYEIEVKTSRSDFFADFKKVDKHKRLSATAPYVQPGFEQYNGYTFIDGYKRYYSYVKCGWDKQPIRQDFEIVFPNKSRPNKFVYAVPEGLVTLDEVPEYAGLLEIREWDNGELSVTTTKPPPFLHKQKNDLTKTLLEKFYWSYRKLKRK